MGAGTLTGCNALGGNKFKNAEDAFGKVENATGLSKGDTGKSAQVTLGKGNYTSFSFTLREQSEMTMKGQAVKGGPVDVYVMTVDQFNNYQRNKKLVGRSSYEAGAEGVNSIDITQQFEPGDYLIVFDNTYVGATSPSGEAQIEFNFVLSGTGQSQNNSTSTPS